jgi:purine-binding chemotaxis protein CheW
MNGDIAAPHDLARAALVVTFQIAQQRYALPVEVVCEIIRIPALVALAGAPPTLCGLLNLRGQFLPVLDGRALVGEPVECDLNSQIVIAGSKWPQLGLLVDQVSDVRSVPAGRLVPISRADVAPFLAGVFEQDGESVLVFDLAALLTLMPKQAKPKSKKRG